MNPSLLQDLWLPIVVSAVVVFIASAVIWMALPIHKNDTKALPDANGVMNALRPFNIPPGIYAFPSCNAYEGGFKNPEFQKAWEAGPRGMLNLWPAQLGMGKNLALMFVFDLVVGLFVAYLASIALTKGAGFGDVFQVCGTAAIMGYALGTFPHAVWENKPPRVIGLNLLDGVIYGALTGLVFAFMWPPAAGAVETIQNALPGR